MRYMLLMADGGSTDPGPDDITDLAEFVAWEKAMQERGITHAGERLRPPAEGVTVRVRDGRALVTDGPFADTKEFIAGYDVLDCADMAEAVTIAAAHPVAKFGAIELRPFWT